MMICCLVNMTMGMGGDGGQVTERVNVVGMDQGFEAL